MIKDPNECVCGMPKPMCKCPSGGSGEEVPQQEEQNTDSTKVNDVVDTANTNTGSQTQLLPTVVMPVNSSSVAYFDIGRFTHAFDTAEKRTEQENDVVTDAELSDTSNANPDAKKSTAPNPFSMTPPNPITKE